MKEKLLSREEYKKQVFSRDNHTCIFCDKPAVDAHHILDRKLWTDGGYYLSDDFYHELVYEKWGNMFQDGRWHKGILFEDDGVQKILKKAGLFYLFLLTFCCFYGIISEIKK